MTISNRMRIVSKKEKPIVPIVTFFPPDSYHRNMTGQDTLSLIIPLTQTPADRVKSTGEDG